MILQALNDLYERLADDASYELPRPGYSTQKVSFCVVLKPDGTLIFKWCEDEIPVSQILALTPEKPLVGHRSGKQQKTHWIAFLKGA